MKKGDSKVFELVKHGENLKADWILRTVVCIPHKTNVLKYNGKDIDSIQEPNKLTSYIGGYEYRKEGDTCRMLLKFSSNYDAPVQYYLWDGFVPNETHTISLRVFVHHTHGYTGVLTGQFYSRLVLIEKYKEQ